MEYAWTRVLVVSAAVALAGGTAGCTAGHPATAAAPRPAAPSFFAGEPFPATFTVPAQPPPALPAGPVGRGALVYQPCPNDDCAPYLVLADGRQYLLGGAPSNSRIRPPLATLSPDGRRLGAYGPHGYTLRDLAGADADHKVDGRPLTWSPDSHWLLTQLDADGPDGRYALVEAWSGTAHAVPVPPHVTVTGVLPSGEVVVVAVDPAAPSGHLSLRVLDGSGTQRRTVDADLAPAGSKYQWFYSTCCLAFGPDGHTVTVQLTWPSDWDTPDAPAQRPPTVFAVVDLASGTVAHRWELPDHRQVTGVARPPEYEAWDLPRVLPVGVVLSHQRGADTHELVLLDPVSGGRRVLSRVPSVYLEVPGGVLGSVVDN